LKIAKTEELPVGSTKLSTSQKSAPETDPRVENAVFAELKPGFYSGSNKLLPARAVRDLVNQLGAAVVQVRTPGGLGSGFIINEDGFLMTNFHVIEGETQISVEVYHQRDGQLERKSYKQVRIIALNKFEDLALLKIDEKDAPKFKDYILPLIFLKRLSDVFDDEIKQLADAKTKLILINSPHNPTGATIGDADMETLHDFTAQRGIQLVSDEVYHPIYHGRDTKSAARLPHATVISDLSKAFSLAGLRTGWMIEHDPVRQQKYWNARAYFSICNTNAGEILTEIAIRNRAVILGKSQQTASRNLQRLDHFMTEHRDLLGWTRPQGGMTAFPWLVSGENARPFCQAATERGILFAPGDCFDVPSHFRLGFAASGENFVVALERFEEFIKSWAAKMVTA